MENLFRKKRINIVLFILLLVVIIFAVIFYFNVRSNPDNENEDVDASDTRIAAVGDSITYDMY
ncbi:MAG: hypothetical protein L0J01_09340, partial [Tetragenococcus halophilus]|nr:hypothetical protein [Tetragenococcus halophilus]